METVLLVLLVVSLLVNGVMGHSAWTRWQWKRKKASRPRRASDEYGRRGL